ncbi:MAG: hypothetical protein ACRDDM_10580 [Paraclostridium sp.]
MYNFNSVNRNVFCAAYVFRISTLITSKLKSEYLVFKEYIKTTNRYVY